MEEQIASAAFEGADLREPLVSVILPCRNERETIKRCLELILSQSIPHGGYEVVVAEGDSDDGTCAVLEDIMRRDSRVRVVRNEGRIVSTGLNKALSIVRGRVIIRMDAHTDYAPDYLVTCVGALEKSGADNVGGPARTKAETFMERAIAAAYHSPFAVGGALFHNIDYEGYVDTVTYGCWWKESFKRYGLFDEELVRNQDDEHNLRIIRGGGRIWQTPVIKSWYRPRGSLGALFRQYSQYGYWKVRVIQKHRLPASWRHLVPGAFVLALLVLPLLILGLWAAWGVDESVVAALSRGSDLASAWAWVLSMWTGLLLSYVGAVCVASVLTARRAGWALAGILPAVFGCYHFGYGWGFLRGVWDFVVRRTVAGERFRRLTR